MADRTALEAAAHAGVIRAEQVAPLYEFLVSRANGAQAATGGEEDLRFIRNFHDVFLATGIVIFALGLVVSIGVYVASAGLDGPAQGAIVTGSLCAGAAVVMWVLGEVFARRRRLFLPAIAIVCAVTCFAVVAAALLYAGAVLGRGFEGQYWDIGQMPPELRVGILIAAAVGALTPFAFYLRFKLPFSLGLAAAGGALFVLAACLVGNFELTMRWLSALMLLLGAILFGAAVAFDARDPARTTRFSDNGFWLHFSAAPLILNGAFGLIGQLFGSGFPSGSGSLIASAAQNNGAAPAHAALTLMVVAGLGVLSLLINRRVLVVSALITTGVAIGILMNSAGLGEGALAASTLVVLGAFVLILGASWHTARRALLAGVKPSGVWALIFPPETAG